jgi:hypothetical protein
VKIGDDGSGKLQFWLNWCCKRSVSVQGCIPKAVTMHKNSTLYRFHWIKCILDVDNVGFGCGDGFGMQPLSSCARSSSTRSQGRAPLGTWMKMDGTLDGWGVWAAFDGRSRYCSAVKGSSCGWCVAHWSLITVHLISCTLPSCYEQVNFFYQRVVAKDLRRSELFYTKDHMEDMNGQCTLASNKGDSTLSISSYYNLEPWTVRNLSLRQIRN